MIVRDTGLRQGSCRLDEGLGTRGDLAGFFLGEQTRPARGFLGWTAARSIGENTHDALLKHRAARRELRLSERRRPQKQRTPKKRLALELAKIPAAALTVDGAAEIRLGPERTPKIGGPVIGAAAKICASSGLTAE